MDFPMERAVWMLPVVCGKFRNLSWSAVDHDPLGEPERANKGPSRNSAKLDDLSRRLVGRLHGSASSNDKPGEYRDRCRSPPQKAPPPIDDLARKISSRNFAALKGSGPALRALGCVPSRFRTPAHSSRPHAFT